MPTSPTLPSLPDNPGCYLFKDGSGRVIYIGKAKSIRKRVQSYFQKTGQDPKTQALVRHVDSVSYIVTDNEVEAILLENNLVKKHNPKYNIKLKDAKRYAFIKLTEEKFPRLLIARRRTGSGKFFGPFVSAAARDYILTTLRKIFQVRTCKRLPRKACLRFHIGLCQAPCIGKIEKEKYARNIRAAEMVLKGKTNELIASLKTEMTEASTQLNYEHALELRKQVEAITWLSEKQNMERQKKYNEDIINFLVKDGKVYLILFNVHKGILENKQEFEFEYDDDILEEFIIQYYSENPVPAELLLPRGVDDSLALFLETRRGAAVHVKVPKKGEKKQLLELVKKNIEVTFFGDVEKLEDLKSVLDLQEIPSVIECFDISHLSGSLTVGAMVQFRNARPDKSNYRRFKIRTVEGIDDPMAIKEVVGRRYRRLQGEHSEMPGLIIIDGGKGQLNSALDELNKLGLKIPVISIAKRFEEIFVPGIVLPLQLDRKGKALQLIQQIRDEAHRFAISYHKLLRQKELRKGDS